MMLFSSYVNSKHLLFSFRCQEHDQASTFKGRSFLNYAHFTADFSKLVHYLTASCGIGIFSASESKADLYFIPILEELASSLCFHLNVMLFNKKSSV